MRTAKAALAAGASLGELGRLPRGGGNWTEPPGGPRLAGRGVWMRWHCSHRATDLPRGERRASQGPDGSARLKVIRAQIQGRKIQQEHKDWEEIRLSGRLPFSLSLPRTSSYPPHTPLALGVQLQDQTHGSGMSESEDFQERP